MVADVAVIESAVSLSCGTKTTHGSTVMVTYLAVIHSVLEL